MKTQQQNITIQALIGNLLQFGVLLSALIIIWGGFFYLLEHGLNLPHLHQFSGEPSELTSISDIIQSAWKGNSSAIIQTGLLVLIFTPIARIILCVFVFALEKDRLYVCLTLIVLGLLLYSLLGNARI